MCAQHLKKLPSVRSKRQKKKGRCSPENCMEEHRKTVKVKWFDNKAVKLASSYVGIEPTDAVKS